jgi:site-specific recombinase XerD
MSSASSDGKALARITDAGLAALRAVPEDQIWLANQRSWATRRAYRDDVAEFLAFFGITESAQLPRVDSRAVIAWRLHLEGKGHKAATIRRKLAALSSLFAHLVERHIVGVNPVRDIARPRLSRRTGTTPAFSPAQARQLLDAPPLDSLQGLRDRAILAVGLQVGARRSEIAHLRVRDFHQTGGFHSLRLLMKGGTDNTVTVHEAVAQRISDYLAAAGHGDDLDGPLFRPVRSGREVDDPRRHLLPQMIDIIMKKYVRQLGMGRGFSAHSMLYDRRGDNPERSPSFFANYSHVDLR